MTAEGLYIPTTLNVANKKPRTAEKAMLVLCFLLVYPNLQFGTPQKKTEPCSVEHGFLSVVMAEGFEPLTACLEGKKK